MSTIFVTAVVIIIVGGAAGLAALAGRGCGCAACNDSGSDNPLSVRCTVCGRTQPGWE